MSKGSQREEAYQTLYKDFMLQKVPVGTRLREVEWSDRLGVNRAALREAFARLEVDGFVQRGAGGGFWVPKLSTNDILDILELRVAFELGAVERICRLKKNTPANLKEAQATCDEFARLMDKDDLLKTPEVDLRFHRAIVKASGNKRLMKIYVRAPLPLIYPEKYSQKEWLAQSTPRTLSQHRVIMDTILKGDVSGASEVLYQHILVRYASDVGKVFKRAKDGPDIPPG